MRFSDSLVSTKGCDVSWGVLAVFDGVCRFWTEIGRSVGWYAVRAVNLSCGELSLGAELGIVGVGVEGMGFGLEWVFGLWMLG